MPARSNPRHSGNTIEELEEARRFTRMLYELHQRLADELAGILDLAGIRRRGRSRRVVVSQWLLELDQMLASLSDTWRGMGRLRLPTSSLCPPAAGGQRRLLGGTAFLQTSQLHMTV
jgi:hypothetical protein